MPAWNPSKPHCGLPSLPPGEEIENRKILKACIASRAALAELNQACKLLPNPTILVNTVPLLEAQASSEIENIVTTTDPLFRYAAQEVHADSATKEVLRYRKALYEGYQLIQSRPLSVATAVEVCRLIKGVDLDIRSTPGTKLVNDLTGEVIYTPPEGRELLQRLLHDLDEFIHREDGIDPLIKMAVMHYQFEAIHPFTDGNGRTGRIMMLLYMVERSLLEIPILYLSRYMIHHRQEYYNLLLEVTKNQGWENWILYVLKAVEETAIWTNHLISLMSCLMQELTEKLRMEAPHLYSREFVEVLFMQPYCRIGNLIDAGVAKRQTASRYLKELVALGVLREVQSGRDKLFVNLGLLDLLTKRS